MPSIFVKKISADFSSYIINVSPMKPTIIRLSFACQSFMCAPFVTLSNFCAIQYADIQVTP